MRSLLVGGALTVVATTELFVAEFLNTFTAADDLTLQDVDHVKFVLIFFAVLLSVGASSFALPSRVSEETSCHDDDDEDSDGAGEVGGAEAGGARGCPRQQQRPRTAASSRPLGCCRSRLRTGSSSSCSPRRRRRRREWGRAVATRTKPCLTGPLPSRAAAAAPAAAAVAACGSAACRC